MPISIACSNAALNSYFPMWSHAMETTCYDRSVPKTFHPLPLGLASHHWAPFNRRIYETDIRLARTRAPPWVKRYSRVLIFDIDNIDTSLDKKTRSKWLRKLRNESFAPLITRITSRVPFETMINLCAQHKYVLSLPGVGYDSFRTWEVLAIGSVPVVVNHGSMDPRLFEHFPVVRIMDHVNSFTPVALEAQLKAFRKTDEAYPPALHTSFWIDRWWQHLEAERRGRKDDR